MTRALTFATDDGSDVCSPARFRHLLDPLSRDRVPLSFTLDYGEIPPNLEVEGVERALLDMLVLARDLARDVQSRGPCRSGRRSSSGRSTVRCERVGSGCHVGLGEGRIEDAVDLDGQFEVHPVRRGGTGCRFAGDSSMEDKHMSSSAQAADTHTLREDGGLVMRSPLEASKESLAS